MTTYTAVDGAPRKAEEIKKLVPPWLETRYPSLAGAILHGLGVSDHQVAVGDRSVFVRGVNPTGDLLYVSKVDDGSIRIFNFVGASNPQVLAASVSGKDITITLETDINGIPTCTAAEVKAEIESVTAVDDLISVTIFGDGDDIVGRTREFIPFDPDGLEGARGDIILSKARGEDLAILARNYGVNKPVLLGLVDTAFRTYIQELAFKPKLIRDRIEGVLTVIFGPKETAGWEVYEIRKKTITIEIPNDLLASGPSVATFLRNGVAVISTVKWTGDYLLEDQNQPPYLRVKPTNVSPVGDPLNNSFYLSQTGSNRQVFLDVLKQVRAAGIKVEFKMRRE